MGKWVTRIIVAVVILACIIRFIGAEHAERNEGWAALGWLMIWWATGKTHDNTIKIQHDLNEIKGRLAIPTDKA